MSIGDREVYPSELKNAHLRGLTYREWLIGMALSNPKIVEFLESTTYENNIEISTKAVIDVTNAIIKQLGEVK